MREIHRKEIARTLNNSVSTHLLTVVAAPAGYGKTVIAKKITGRKRRRFFSSIPEDIADAAQWWDRLFESLAEQGMEHAQAIRRIGFPQTPSATRRVLELLESVAEPFVLILDDCHNFNDPAVDAFLETAIRAAPPDHRFVLFSRVRPRMNLGDLEQSGLAAVYDQKLLEFSREDAVRFFFLNGIPDRNAAISAWRYSEGWVSALWLCLRNLKSGRKTSPANSMEKLLDDAVFAGYSAAEQEFLMRLSVLGSFTVREAEALTGHDGAAGLLLELSGGNAFIRRDESGGTFVVHSIFRDFLGKKLAARPDVDTPDLYRRAAECRIRRRESLPAFRLLARAGRDEDLLRILEVIVADGEQSIYKTKCVDFIPILEKIPWRLRLERPLGYLLFVWLCFDDDLDAPRSVALFEEMAKRFGKAKTIPPQLKRRLAGEVEFMRGWIYTTDELHLIAPRYETARKLLDGPSVLRYDRNCWNFGSPHALFAYLPAGVRYEELIGILDRANGPMRVLTGYAIEGCASVAEIEYRLERGEFGTAARLLDELDRILDFPRNMTSVIMARFLRARLAVIRGEEEDIAGGLNVLLHDIMATGSSDHIQCAELALGCIFAHCGEPDAAPRWLRDCDIFDRPYGATRISGFMAMVSGKLLLAKGDLRRLAEFLSGREDIFHAERSTFGAIHEAVFKAVLAASADEALEQVRKAVGLSRPDGFVLPVAEYGGHVLPLLIRLAEETPDDMHLKKIVATAEEIETVRRRRETRARRELSGREREIMRFVSRGKSSGAIAKKLGTTQSAVKNAVALAYKKLGVRNRTEAARIFQLSLTRKTPAATAENEPADIPPELRRLKRALSGRGFADPDFDVFPRPAGENALCETLAGQPPRRAERDGETGERLMRHGDLAGAFHCFLRSVREEDWSRSLELFSLPESGKMLAFCFEEIRTAVQLFPWPARLARPVDYLAFLWRCFRVFDRGASTAELEEAEHRLSASVPDPEGKLAGEIALLRSILHAHDTDALWDGYGAAARLLKGRSYLYSLDSSWTFGNPHCTFAAVREPGGFAKLAGRAASASEALSALSGGVFASLETAFRMEWHLERGETGEAYQLLPALENHDDDMQAIILATFARARLLLAEGRVEAAVDALELLVPRVRRFNSFEHSESLDLALGYVYAQLGQAGKAAPWIRSGQVGTPPHGAAARCAFAAVAHGKTLLAARDFARLESTARTLPVRFGAYGSLLGRIHAKVWEAIAKEHRRRRDEALVCLREALELARADGLVFSIAEYRGHVLPLLRRLHRENPGDEHFERAAAFAEKKYSHAASGKNGAGGRHILTPREREIMQCVLRGKTNHAIALELGVSVARVSSALGNIYEKLGVTNRVEASRRFAALGNFSQF